MSRTWTDTTFLRTGQGVLGLLRLSYERVRKRLEANLLGKEVLVTKVKRGAPYLDDRVQALTVPSVVGELNRSEVGLRKQRLLRVATSSVASLPPRRQVVPRAQIGALSAGPEHRPASDRLDGYRSEDWRAADRP